MNRRTFIASLITVPAAVTAAVKLHSHVEVMRLETKTYTLRSIDADLDEIFRRIYAVQNRGRPAEIIFPGGEEEYKATCDMLKRIGDAEQNRRFREYAGKIRALTG